MNKQFYVLEMNNFTEDEAMEFLNEILHDVKWGKNKGMVISHLTEKGVQDLKQHVFKQTPTYKKRNKDGQLEVVRIEEEIE